MNAFTERLNNSWQLFKRSVLVIQQNPKLLVFPIVTGILTAIIALFFLAPVGLVLAAPHWVGGTKIKALADSIGFLRFHDGAKFTLQPLGTAMLGGIYLLN